MLGRYGFFHFFFREGEGEGRSIAVLLFLFPSLCPSFSLARLPPQKMAFAGGFRGVSAAQDARFSDKQQKLLKTMKFSKELLRSKVDMNRVNWSVMRGWISRKTEELLGFEDEVLNGYIAEQLEGQEVRQWEWGKRGEKSSGRRTFHFFSPPLSSSPLASFHASLSLSSKTKKTKTVCRPARPPDQPHALPRVQDAQVRHRALEAPGLGVGGGALGGPSGAPGGRGEGPRFEAQEAAQG